MFESAYVVSILDMSVSASYVFTSCQCICFHGSNIVVPGVSKFAKRAFAAKCGQLMYIVDFRVCSLHFFGPEPRDKQKQMNTEASGAETQKTTERRRTDASERTYDNQSERTHIENHAQACGNS
jgi:hypothetical protein